MTDVVTTMLEHEHKDHLSIEILRSDLIGKTFGEVIQKVNSHEQFLLGIRRHGKTQLHPNKHFYLQKEDELIYVRR